MLVYTHACTGYIIQILLTVNLQMTYTSLKISFLVGYEEFDFAFSVRRPGYSKNHTDIFIASDQFFSLKAL